MKWKKEKRIILKGGSKSRPKQVYNQEESSCSSGSGSWQCCGGVGISKLRSARGGWRTLLKEREKSRAASRERA